MSESYKHEPEPKIASPRKNGWWVSITVPGDPYGAAEIACPDLTSAVKHYLELVDAGADRKALRQAKVAIAGAVLYALEIPEPPGRQDLARAY